MGCSGGSDSAVAVEAAIRRLQWRRRFSGCSGGSDSADAVEAAKRVVVVEAVIQQLWWRQRFSGCGGDSDSAIVVAGEAKQTWGKKMQRGSSSRGGRKRKISDKTSES